jgi:2'-5' RNA ligase
MYAIASVLNSDENVKIQNIWDELTFHCQLKAVQQSPIPHFSWLTYTDVQDPDAFNESLSNWANSHAPFTVKVNGIGIFPGNTPVLYLPIVRNYALSALHYELLSQLSPHLEGTSSLYAPDAWIPHITLAFHDLTYANLNCAITQCLKFDLSFNLYVDHIAILYLDETSFGLQRKINLTARTENISFGGIT